MKKSNEHELFEIWAYCDWKDKSTEYMLTRMADTIESWDESDAAEWIEENSSKRTAWYKANEGWYKKYE